MTLEVQSPWTDVDGIAARFNVGVATIYNWMKLDRPIPSVKLGGKRMFNIDDVDAWARSRWSLHIDSVDGAA